MKPLTIKQRDGRYFPAKTLLCIAGVYLVWLGFGKVPDLLIYDRELIKQGELWRLITAHFVHVDNEHLILNLCALLILGASLEYLNTKLFLPVLLAGILAINLGLWFEIHSILYYCGLSGVLNSFFVIVLWQLWRTNKDYLVLFAGVINFLKIMMEINSGDALFSSISWPPLPQAHLLGVLGGAFFADASDFV